MKKLLVVAVVLAIACLSSVAFAAEVTVNGQVDVRSRMFENYDLNKNVNTGDTESRTYTENRYMLDVNVKSSDTAKAKLSLWNEHFPYGSTRTFTSTGNAAGSVDGSQGAAPSIREAWLDIMLPDMPIGIKAGKQVMQLANGWFFRSNYGGSEAWIVYSKQGNNTFAFQDVKLVEGVNTTSADDADLYTAMGTMKQGDMTFGVDLSVLRDNKGIILAAPTAPANGDGKLYNLGLNFNGKVGPATIKATLGLQNGKAKVAAGDTKYKGNELVVQASLPMDKLTVNATVARGTGDKAGSADHDGVVSILDITRHYTFIYEYRIAAATGKKYSGFANTTALNVGAGFQAAKSLKVGADLWFLQATEKTNVNSLGGAGTGSTSNDLGTELDAYINWQIAPNVSWNWDIGYFKPGSAYKNAAGVADDAYGVQGVLALSF